MDIRLRVGIVVTGEEAITTDLPKRNLNAVKKRIDKLNIEQLHFKELLSNDSVAKKAGKFFTENSVDVLLVVAGSWASDNYVVSTTKFLECPVIYWSPPEELEGWAFPEAGSLVGTLQNCGVLTKIGKKVKIIIDDPAGEEGFRKFKEYIEVLETIKRLSFSNMGLVGSGCPGMLDTSFHELELRRQIGPDVIRVFTSDIIREVEKIGDIEARKVVEKEIDTGQITGIDEARVLESIKIYMVTRKYVEQYGLSGVAFRCWPDFKDNGLCSPCFALSKLADEGVVTACEGDVTAGVSMLVLRYLTGRSVYLGDLLRVNKQTRVVEYFHCGAMPTELAEKKSEIAYRKHASGHAWKPGMTVNFPLKPGRVTFARVGEISGRYRILAYTGEAIKSDMFVMGNPGKVKLDKDPEYILEGLVENGSEHHQIAVHGDLTEKLRLFCEFTGLDFILL